MYPFPVDPRTIGKEQQLELPATHCDASYRPAPPGNRETVPGLLFAVILKLDDVGMRLTVPVKPPTGVRVMEEFQEAPGVRGGTGAVVIEKSLTPTITYAVCEADPLFEEIETR